jgi:hypothetical protein
VVWIGMHIATLIYQKWPYQDWCLGYNTQRTVIEWCMTSPILCWGRLGKIVCLTRLSTIFHQY